ncbi:hypothetical protein CK501_16565 [Halovibrio salipaludis]|uniref:Glycosyltransferase 2-like domain-containing protein n=1 Tax=Halovibrio salipaludis TaxID=2032626 RepID=A0A2A2ESB0_9GAMM|nr:hypothetical protein CK501_16565 [Halovibrio salipaludis]
MSEMFRSAPNENQIMSHWDQPCDCAVISIWCPTYNHDNYIEKTICGFLHQKTQYPFEIVIHNDASNDDTDKIIKKYKKLYPNIIKYIKSRENQFQKGIKPTRLASKYCSGEYIAFCDGDDYWTSDLKIQLQAAALKRYETKDICLHPAFLMRGNSLSKIRNNYSNHETILTLDFIIRYGGGVMPTSSIMIKSKIIYSLPNWFDSASEGDTFFQILGSTNGAIYLPWPMSIYRCNTTSSMSNALKRASKEKLSQKLKGQEFCLDCLDRDLQYQLHDAITELKAKTRMQYAQFYLESLDNKSFRGLIGDSWSLKKSVSKRQRLLHFLRHMPWMIRILIKGNALRWKILNLKDLCHLKKNN